MTLIISNSVVAQVLTMETTIAALESAYRDLANGDAVCRPRIDIQIPTSDARKIYQWGTMEGGSRNGYFAIRMKSDVIFEEDYNGATTQAKYCVRPGLYCGLILLTAVDTGEPLAIINDGVLQHMRVGADGAIGVKYMANPDAAVVGVLGSGGMARSHMEAFMLVRSLKRLQVYSPTRANREAFATEMAQRYGIEAVVCDRPEDVYKGADIVAGLTDSRKPVLDGRLLQSGSHVVNVGAGGKPDPDTLKRVDAYLRFGDAPAPIGLPELAIPDEYITWAARPDLNFRLTRSSKRAPGTALPDKMVTLKQIMDGGHPGRTSREQITYSERGNLQGVQFYALAAKVYELARQAGLGHELPTDLFLQDVRD